jgi:hypothetical protein
LGDDYSRSARNSHKEIDYQVAESTRASDGGKSEVISGEFSDHDIIRHTVGYLQKSRQQYRQGKERYSEEQRSFREVFILIHFAILFWFVRRLLPLFSARFPAFEFIFFRIIPSANPL